MINITVRAMVGVLVRFRVGVRARLLFRHVTAASFQVKIARNSFWDIFYKTTGIGTHLLSTSTAVAYRMY